MQLIAPQYVKVPMVRAVDPANRVDEVARLKDYGMIREAF